MITRTGAFWLHYWRDGRVVWVRYDPVGYNGTARVTPQWSNLQWWWP
jgi:hypothetical protein